MGRGVGLVALVVVTGCGDNLPGPTPTGTARVSLVAPATAATSTIPIHLDITGDVSATDLAIVVVEPGTPEQPDLPRFLAVGVAPPTGVASYLAADGTWSQDVQLASTTPATTDLTLVLPSVTEGEWGIRAELRPRSGGFGSIATDNVVISATPAVALSLDRFWVASGRPVHAAARIAHGYRDDLALELVAWLTLPDGTQLSLPDLQPALTAALLPVVGDRAELLDRDLAVHGPGNYDVGVRLVDPETGTILGAASAGFTVCDAAGHLSGTVRDDQGAPLGAGASRASLYLASMDDPELAATAPIAGDGSYAVDLPVGRWFVTGTVDDGAGTHDIALHEITVGCDAPASLDLGAAVPATAVRTANVRAPKQLILDQPPGCGLTPIMMLVKPAYQRDSIITSQLDSLTKTVLAETRETTDPSQIVFKSWLELTDTMEVVVLKQKLGCNDPKNCDGGTSELRNVFDVLTRTDFTVLVDIEQHDTKVDKYDVSIKVIDEVGGGTIPLLTETRTPTKSGLKTAVVEATNSILVGLVPYLRQYVRPIHNPKFEMSTTPARPIAGQAFTFNTVLTDAQTCRLAPVGTAIEMSELANAPPLITPTRARTNISGIASVMGMAPSSATVGKFHVIYRDYSGTSEADQVVAFQRPATNGLDVSADRIRLGVGDDAHGVVVFANHPNTMLRLVGTRGAVPSTIVTDSNGRASFTFTATTAGLANVEVMSIPAFTDDADSNVGFWVDAPLTITLSTPMPAIHTNTLAPVQAKVELSGGVPAVGVPILFDVTSGSGALSTSVATTDASGLTTVVFTAPSQAGTTEVTGSGSIDTARAQDVLAIQILAPCPDCPVEILGPDLVPKGASSHFYANQLVTWSVTSGTIASSGAYTAGTAGGIWTATATSLENPGQVGHRDFIVECSDAELGAPHLATPQDPLGGGKSYNIHQTITNVQSGDCAPAGASDGILHIYTRPTPTPTTVDVAEAIVPPLTCSSDLFGFGAIQFLPTIYGCHISSITQVAGCYVEEIEISVVGPGISGVAGTLHEGHYDGATTTCSTMHDITFVSF